MLPRASLLRLPLLFATTALAGEPPLRSAPPPPPPRMVTAVNPLSWDAIKKTHHAKPGEEAAEFVFTVTNTSDQEVEILRINPSCGCTVPHMPARPWVLAPGAKSSFTANMDFKGKSGTFAKTLSVESSRGQQTLTVAVEIPELDDAARRRNQELARANRQIVFQNDCAACHVTPLVGKKGGELFQVACGICHLAHERASIVPDLLVARETRDEAYWRKWISEGKEATLMPAFAQSRGGPLNDEQIDSLVEYLTKNFATKPAAPATLPPAH